MSRNRLVPRALPALALAGLLAAVASAADPVTPADAKAFDKLVVDTLRDVHNKGADLYNEKMNYEGAYRLYQGALLTVRPLLTHRPATQKLIDDGLAAADKDADLTKKGFILHETIEKVRTDLRGAGGEPKKPDDTKKPADPPKKVDEPKKPDDKKPADPPAKGDGATVTGKVTLQGKPLGDGDISFVSLDKKEPKVMTAALAADGTYTAKDVPPGKYAVSVAGAKTKTPAKYATTDTSGLTVEVKAGANTFDVELK